MNCSQCSYFLFVLITKEGCQFFCISVNFAPYRRIFQLRRFEGAQTELIMYAVFQSGGKQHRVTEGQTIRLEKLDVETGAAVEFDSVLLVADGEKIEIGVPFVNGGKITAEVVSHGRGEKIKVVKFRRRKHSRNQMGHRQWFTEVKITGISA